MPAENVVLYATEDEGNLPSRSPAPSDPQGKAEDDPDRGKIVAPLPIFDQVKMDDASPTGARSPDVCELQPRGESRRARGPKIREWNIQIEKTGSLGLDIGKDKTSMLIGRVSDGPIQAWNDAEGRDPADIVARGDRILEVNGARGDAQEILKTLSTSTSLSISLSRLMEFRITNLPNDGPLGIEFDSSTTQYLIIKTIGEGSAQTVNRKLKPDCELRPGDLILEVNGEMGDAPQLEAALGKTNLLTLLVRRPL